MGRDDMLVSQVNTAARGDNKQKPESFRNRILDLIEKLDTPDSNEAARKLVVIGKDPKTKQQAVTIIQEQKNKLQQKIRELQNKITLIINTPSRHRGYGSEYKTARSDELLLTDLMGKIDRVLKEIQKKPAKMMT